MDTENPQSSPPPRHTTQKQLTWRALGWRIVGGYLLFGIASEIFAPAITPANLTKAQKAVTVAITHFAAFSAILIITTIVALLAAKIPSSNRAQPIPRFINYALIVALAIGGIAIYGNWDSRQHIPFTPSIGSQGSESAPISVTVNVEDSRGIREEDFVRLDLKQLERLMLETALQQSKDAYSKGGGDPGTFNTQASSSSVYATIDGKTVAIVKLRFMRLSRLGEAIRFVYIVGIRGKEMVTILCMRNGDQEIPAFSGECGDKVKEVFSLSTLQQR